MRLPRNPFRSLKVESLESHDLFLKLFQPLAIGALGSEPWEAVQLIRSAQGGGKTSLLRVFTPECLRRLSASLSGSHLTDISEAIRQIGALSDTGPQVLGIYIPLASTPYATLARAKVGSKDPLHLFYALLDARTILTALRGVSVLQGGDIENDLDRITLHFTETDATPFSEFSTARTLYEWAKDLERTIWRAVDRGSVDSVMHLGHAKPYALEFLSSKAFLFDNDPICERVVVMIDDCHKLAANQRTALLEHVITSRLSVSVWIAERMHAMEPYELLALDTSSSARECRPVVLSMWWQKATESSTNRFYRELADKRLVEANIDTTFEDLLASRRKTEQNDPELRKMLKIVSLGFERVKEREERYRDLAWPQRPQQTTRDYLIELRALQLYIEGKREKPQQGFDVAGMEPDPQPSDLTGLKATAEYQVCELGSLPLYYGPSEVYKVASWNVDQFLNIGSGLFDQLDAQRVRNVGETINPKVQQAIIKRIAEEYWTGLPKRMADGDKMQRFLQNVAKHARKESLGPTAKYPPGVTGIGITSRDHDRLRYCSADKDEHLVDFAELLSSAVAHNVLFMRADSKQGRKGDTSTVFYFNRLLCVYFGLPIGLGGWWKRKADHFASLLGEQRIADDEEHTPSLFETVEEGG